VSTHENEIAMRYRTLGRTGIAVSPYALGAMMFGSMGNRDHDDAIRITHRALDADARPANGPPRSTGNEMPRPACCYSPSASGTSAPSAWCSGAPL